MSTISAGVTVPTGITLSSDTTGALTFQVSGTVTAATISSAGNFGIGTTSPIQRLTVESTSDVRATIRNSTENTSYASSLDFATGSGSLASTNVVARVQGLITQADPSALQSALAFHTNTGDSVSEKMRIDNNGNVGIGTTSPGAKLEVFTGSTTTSGLRINRFASGVYYSELRQVDNPEGLAFLVGNGTSISEKMRITGGGEVYIAGTTDQGAYNLQVNGTGVWGAGAYVNGSDARLKDNITSLDSGLDVVAAMRPVTFQYKPEYSKDQSVQPGFIAQELQQAMAGKNYLDGVVQEGPNYLNVAYQNIIPILVKAMQEQQEQIKALQDKIAILESK